MNKLTSISLAGARPHARAHRVNVLIACEESQAECSAFRSLGFNAYSCDVQPCRPGGHPEWHIMADVTPYLSGCVQFTTMDGKSHHVSRWHLIIAHPPCTYLCRISSPLMWQNGELNVERFGHMVDARQFFFKCLDAQADFVAVENPIPMRLANLPRPNAYACPSWYGVKYTKKTLYWLRNLPPLVAQIDFPNPKCYIYASRGKYRSRTFPQLAAAIAEQWGKYVLDNLPE